MYPPDDERVYKYDIPLLMQMLALAFYLAFSLPYNYPCPVYFVDRVYPAKSKGGKK
jgi:hypothetical protein